jgi:hypothetical protein
MFFFTCCCLLGRNACGRFFRSTSRFRVQVMRSSCQLRLCVCVCSPGSIATGPGKPIRRVCVPMGARMLAGIRGARWGGPSRNVIQSSGFRNTVGGCRLSNPQDPSPD